jgi:hypothetical protein
LSIGHTQTHTITYIAFKQELCTIENSGGKGKGTGPDIKDWYVQRTLTFPTCKVDENVLTVFTICFRYCSTPLPHTTFLVILQQHQAFSIPQLLLWMDTSLTANSRSITVDIDEATTLSQRPRFG